ncbi:dihydrofolate reductase family protein [Litorihabitans aurantiacus]|uniref:Deaminase reductase n=1 Tax=Litorihabitans aurantiacus TaxID=1930061 RepID=A0AA38CTG2_9MICO|nr:dihydrofolate reductase family protein [Litorihabitans aurantiacus]GMA32771.1 deaminase reductase [Litorihabitans aurantiacus]
MGRIVIEQIITADGFVQDSEGGMKFMDAAPIDSADSDQLEMLERVGAIVLGRRTYEMFAGYWPTVDPADEPVAAPINSLPKHVVSRTLEVAPWGRHEAAILERAGAVATLERLRTEVDGDLLVWGSLQLTDALFRAGLVDVLRLRQVPSLIGDGRGPTPSDLDQTVITQVASHVGSNWVTTEYAVR